MAEQASSSTAEKTGLDMAFSLTLRGFEMQDAAFDAVDNKSSQIIGYVAVAIAMLGLGLSQRQPSAIAAGLTIVGLAALVAAMGFALAGLRVKEISGLPSGKESFDYWRQCGDEEAARVFIEEVEAAQDRLYELTGSKCQNLERAYLCVLVGMGSMVAAVAVGIAGGG